MDHSTVMERNNWKAISDVVTMCVQESSPNDEALARYLGISKSYQVIPKIRNFCLCNMCFIAMRHFETTEHIHNFPKYIYLPSGLH